MAKQSAFAPFIDIICFRTKSGRMLIFWELFSRPNFSVILWQGRVTSLTSYLRRGEGRGGGALKGREGDHSSQIWATIQQHFLSEKAWPLVSRTAIEDKGNNHWKLLADPWLFTLCFVGCNLCPSACPYQLWVTLRWHNNWFDFPSISIIPWMEYIWCIICHVGL